MSKQPCVYILANKKNGTIYIGVTSNLIKRIWEHKQSLIPGFTNKYKVHNLMWYEQHSTMDSAISKEKALKNWKRSWKIRLIESKNPEWEDIYHGLL